MNKNAVTHSVQQMAFLSGTQELKQGGSFCMLRTVHINISRNNVKVILVH
jgi:hypothetical protein